MRGTQRRGGKEDGQDGDRVPERTATGAEPGAPWLSGLLLDPEASVPGEVVGGASPIEKSAVAVVATNAKRATIANIYALGYQIQLAMPRFPRILLVAQEFVAEFCGNHRIA